MGMLEGVGQRLLDDPVNSEFNGATKWDRRAISLKLNGKSSRPESLDKLAELCESWLWCEVGR
jgi:hypothetical protein